MKNLSSPPPAIDPLDHDSHLTCAQAARLVPGRNVSPHTIWRWSSKGRKGIKLPTIPTASGRVTSRSALRWFYAELQRVDQQPAAPQQRRRQLDPAIVAACEAAGI